ncbi:MAG: LOG family protein [Candidatus Brennerbacteria bacterium]|nr:LOG family protein [Candidatus Brennerbacteria bacterium]
MKKNNNAPPRNHNHHHSLKYKFCVSGAAETGHCPPDALERAEQLGKAIAERGLVLMTGATTGIPYWSAKGAKAAGGTVIGLSPAASKVAHLKTYHLPLDYHDVVVYTGFEYSGRNLLLTRSSDAVIVVCGRIGTLNEFTIAFEDDKPIGVLEGSGGTADMLRELLAKSHRGMGKVIFAKDPETLVARLLDLVESEEEKNGVKGRIL